MRESKTEIRESKTDAEWLKIAFDLLYAHDIEIARQFLLHNPYVDSVEQYRIKARIFTFPDGSALLDWDDIDPYPTVEEAREIARSLLGETELKPNPTAPKHRLGNVQETMRKVAHAESLRNLPVQYLGELLREYITIQDIANTLIRDTEKRIRFIKQREQARDIAFSDTIVQMSGEHKAEYECVMISGMLNGNNPNCIGKIERKPGGNWKIDYSPSPVDGFSLANLIDREYASVRDAKDAVVMHFDATSQWKVLP